MRGLLLLRIRGQVSAALTGAWRSSVAVRLLVKKGFLTKRNEFKFAPPRARDRDTSMPAWALLEDVRTSGLFTGRLVVTATELGGTGWHKLRPRCVSSRDCPFLFARGARHRLALAPAATECFRRRFALIERWQSWPSPIDRDSAAKRHQ